MACDSRGRESLGHEKMEGETRFRSIIIRQWQQQLVGTDTYRVPRRKSGRGGGNWEKSSWMEVATPFLTLLLTPGGRVSDKERRLGRWERNAGWGACKDGKNGDGFHLV